MKKRKKIEGRIVTLLVLFLTLGLGYALLHQNLTITGTSKLSNSSWDIHFDNLNVSRGSVSLSNGDEAAEIDDTTKTDINYTVTLQQPGDFYEFTVDIENEGTIDGMIESFYSKLNGTDISATNPVPSHLTYSVTYDDGMPIEINNLYAANSTDTIRVRVEFKRDISSDQLPSTPESYSFSFGIVFVQSDGSATERQTRSFENDSWETIVSNVHNNTIPAYYTVGSTKTIEMDLNNDTEMETYTVRIANKLAPNICNTTGFSQTACGFVLEFTDIITKHSVNVTYDNDTVGTGNVGGWRSSAIRTYLNSTIYNALPSVIKNAIIDTTVVSGHGVTTGETNFTSTDKLYLLSTLEIYNEPALDTIDSTITRQLDYYANTDTTSSSHASAIKKYDGSDTFWWLRSACNNANNYFNVSNTVGGADNSAVTDNNGVSPAFRIR